MAITEIFPNPTVKSVYFELKFPNLFFLESKVGDFQLRVLDRFPDTSIAYRRQFVFADVAPGKSAPDFLRSSDEDTGLKAWQFKSPDDYSFTLETNSLLITSQRHKTYNLGAGDRFREVIQFVTDAFLKVVDLPSFTRIGLRYVDVCPLPKKEDATYASHYNTAFPLKRFSVNDATEMVFQTVVARGDAFLRYSEQLNKEGEQWNVLLDFDGFRERISAGDYLTVTDSLHDVISKAYEETIKTPVLEYMRKGAKGK